MDFRAVPVGAADASYNWNFNTFIDTPGETASFTFEEPGEYAVTLKVQSGDRLRTVTKIVTVTGGEPTIVQRPYTIDTSEVGESVPPSTYRFPLITTGAYHPGMAQEAVTASASVAGGAPSRPNAVRAPEP